jgi:hypothetical protein
MAQPISGLRIFVPVPAPPSSISALVSVLSSAVTTGSSAVAIGCSSEDSGCHPEDPGRFSENPVTLPKVPSLLRSPRGKAPELKPSRRGMYAVNLSRQAYLRRRFVHCLLSPVLRPSNPPIPHPSSPILVRSARQVCGAALVLVFGCSSPRSSPQPPPSSPLPTVIVPRPAHSSQLRLRSSPQGLRSSDLS